ncbi:hypothetical protein ACHAO8_011048 [Botrytis cinerea]
MVVDGKLCQTPIPKSERTETLENLIVLIGENYGTNPSWQLSVELEPAHVFPENFDIKLLRDSAENSNFTIEGLASSMCHTPRMRNRKLLSVADKAT